MCQTQEDHYCGHLKHAAICRCDEDGDVVEGCDPLPFEREEEQEASYCYYCCVQLCDAGEEPENRNKDDEPICCDCLDMEENGVCCLGCGERVCDFDGDEEPPHKNKHGEAMCEMCWEEN